MSSNLKRKAQNDIEPLHIDKQRKIPKSASESTQSQTTKHDPYLVLKTLLLHHNVPQSSSLSLDLARRAKKHLTRPEASSLLDLLNKMGLSIIRAESLIANSHQLHHCARCHKPYLEIDNVGKVCCIKHEIFNDEPDNEGGDRYSYTCKSCDIVGIEEGAGNGIDWPNRGICFEGKHTPYAAEVFYDGDNTERCEEKGCKVYHCVRCHQMYDVGYEGPACGVGEGLVHTTKVEVIYNGYDGEDIKPCEEFGCHDEDEDD